MRMALDCGNGAAYRLAPELFARLGAETIVLNAGPDGRNINLNCGALHVEGLRDAVLANAADFGVAFDGDADRAIFVAKSGKIVDGDAVLLTVARAMKAAEPAARRYGGRHRDVEPGSRKGARSRRHSHGAHARGR